MNDEEALDWALVNAPRSKDGDIAEAVLVEWVAKKLAPVDVEAEKALRAVKVVKGRQEKGCRTHGRLHLPGIDPYDYEPDRLLKDKDRNVVEKAKARPRHTAAGLARMRQQFARLANGLSRYGEENDRFQEWALDALDKGVPWEKVTFDNFIHDADLWEPEPEPEDDADLEPDPNGDGDD